MLQGTTGKYTVRVVSEVFKFSPKRDDPLSKTMKELLPSVRRNHLIDVCKTRWVARIDGLDMFVEVYLVIVATLEEIRCNTEGSWNNESTQKANSLYHSIINFQFLVTLVIASRCLEVTGALTKQLQSFFS